MLELPTFLAKFAFPSVCFCSLHDDSSTTDVELNEPSGTGCLVSEDYVAIQDTKDAGQVDYDYSDHQSNKNIYSLKFSLILVMV